MDYNLKNLNIKINMIGFFQKFIHEIYIFFKLSCFLSSAIVMYYVS